MWTANSHYVEKVENVNGNGCRKNKLNEKHLVNPKQIPSVLPTKLRNFDGISNVR